MYVDPSILAETGRLERENPLRKVEASDFEPLFGSRLEARYSADKQLLVQEADEQQELVARLKEANASFLASRRIDSSLKDRETAIQMLESGFMKYKELIANMDVGRKFYNDLARLLSRFSDEAKHFVYQRRIEAGRIEVYTPLPPSPPPPLFPPRHLSGELTVLPSKKRNHTITAQNEHLDTDVSSSSSSSPAIPTTTSASASSSSSGGTGAGTGDLAGRCTHADTVWGEFADTLGGGKTDNEVASEGG